MKKKYNRYEKINREISALEIKKWNLEKEQKQKQAELDKYCKRNRSINLECIETGDVEKLNQIYDYMDKKYPVEWQGGLRADNRGMKMHFWLSDDPDYLIVHLSSTSPNIYLSGSTSWEVKAKTLTDKVEVIKTIKKDLLKIINKRG